MRTKSIIHGLKNSQKFRFILCTEGGDEFGMTITVQQMSDQMVTAKARVAVWTALERLAFDRNMAKSRGKPMPTGLVCDTHDFRQVQVDLF